jgi:hypothetical protein
MEHAFDAVETQPAFGAVVAVAAHTGRLEQRLNVPDKREVLFLSRFGQLGKVQLAEIPFVCRQQQPWPSQEP